MNESLDDYAMASETSDRFTDTFGCILRPHLQHTTFWFNMMGKSKGIGSNIMKGIIDLHKSCPWEQFPDAWLCRVHRIKQFYASEDMMGISDQLSGDIGQVL